MIAPAMRMQYCSDSLPDGALQKLGVKRVRVSLGDHLQNRTKHKSGGAKGERN